MGKSNVVGLKVRDTNRIVAKVVSDTKSETVQPFVLEDTQEDATVCADEAKSYKGIDRTHETSAIRLAKMSDSWRMSTATNHFGYC